MSFATRVIQLIKENPSIIGSILLVVFVPLSLFFHTFLTIRSFRLAFDETIIDQARTLGILLDGLIDDLNDQDQLKEAIALTKDQSSYLAALNFSVPVRASDDTLLFRVIAASNQANVGKEIKEVESSLAWSEDGAFGSEDASDQGRFWIVVSPLHDREGQKIGLSHIALSLGPVSSLVERATLRSYLILVAIIIVTLLLLANHTRLFEYTVLYKKLKEVDKAKDEFISIASHELRTPVSSIAILLTMARQREFGEITKDMEEKLEEAIRLSQHLELLIEDMLDASRIEQGRLQLDMRANDIVPLCKEVSEALRPMASKKGLAFAINIAQSEVMLSIDPARFKQILINLLGNAIKYTNDGEITLEVLEDTFAKKVEIKISDSGMGISAEDQAQLFQKFFRAPNRETRSQRGTGLGLWIAKQLSELMGGKLFLESIRGKGSVFLLIFPVAVKQ